MPPELDDAPPLPGRGAAFNVNAEDIYDDDDVADDDGPPPMPPRGGRAAMPTPGDAGDLPPLPPRPR